MTTEKIIMKRKRYIDIVTLIPQILLGTKINLLASRRSKMHDILSITIFVSINVNEICAIMTKGRKKISKKISPKK